MEPSCGGLLANDEVVSIDKCYGLGIRALHISLVRLLVDYSLCAIALDNHHLKVVLEAVYEVVVELTTRGVA